MSFHASLNEDLKVKMEGMVYENLFLKFVCGIWRCHKIYLTVKNGIVYEIRHDLPKKLDPTNNSLWDVWCDCRPFGKYNPYKKYQTKKSTLTQVQLKRLLKL